MNQKSYGWALILLVLLFGVAAIVAYRHNHATVLAIPTANNLAQYANNTYGYSFYYPPEDSVRVLTESEAIIGRATSSDFITYAEVRVATSSSSASYRDFVLSTLKGLCEEKPGYSCSGTIDSSTYTSATRLAGTKYYLTLTTPDGTTERFGPLYVFNIGGNVVDAAYALLVVYRPLTATSPLDALPAEDVASKVQIQKVGSQ